MEENEQRPDAKPTDNTFELNFGVVKIRLNGEATKSLVPYIGRVLLIVGSGVTIAYLISVWKQ